MHTPPPLSYIVNHVFLPPKLPQSDDSSMDNDLALCDLATRTAQDFATTLSQHSHHWKSIVRMMTNITSLCSMNCLDRQTLHDLLSQLRKGDILVIPIRAQNACVIARRLESSTIFESFEVDPPNQQVMATPARLVRSFPGPALEMVDTPMSPSFLKELVTFLADMDVVDAGSAPSTKKAGSTVFEVRDTSDPHYITQLLTSILHGCPGSRPADVDRFEKRVRNEILWDRTYEPWRRSHIWLIIRVALQSTLQRATPDGCKEYKTFMIFLLTDVVLSVNDCDVFSTDHLVCIQTKIARRLKKLDSDASPTLILKATQAISKARAVVEKRWNEIRQQAASISPTWSPQDLDIHGDTNISLLSSKSYLSRRLEESPHPSSQPVFIPSEAPRLTDDDFILPENVARALSLDPLIALADVEEFAVNRLEAWVDRHRRNPSVCVDFATCITHYATAAREQYKDNPENQSLMLLTVFLLWSALDRLAIIKHPLLADYSPEIPEKMMDSLLLRQSDSIASLIRLRKYLRTRHHNAQGSVFSDNLSSATFAIRFFHKTTSLRNLKEKIETEAKVERDKRRQEFARLKAQHTQLINQANSMQHSSHWSKLKKLCKRCSLERQAKKLNISVHEWPLAQDKFAAEATVFELQCPPEYQSWRDTTYAILYNFCRPEQAITGTKPEVKMKLPDYPALKHHHKGQNPRIVYASPTKAFVKSHYASQKIEIVDSSLSSILVNNGLSYSLFDTVLGRWVKNSFAECAIESLCTFQLQASSRYHASQYAMRATVHSDNMPLAEQADVPPQLNLHEHISFGTLRSGPILQWLNILRELRARTLSFDRFEVHLLFTQAALQTGSMAKGDSLEWHNLLQRGDFALALLAEAKDLLLSVQNNWQHVFTLQTVIILVTRLLACLNHLEDHGDVVVCACSTLRSARAIAFSWVGSLTADAEDLSRTDSDEATSDLLCQRVCAAAATCRATYDVDPLYFDHLINSQEDLSIFIQCAIRLHDNSPGPAKIVAPELSLLLARDRRLSRRIGPTVWNRIQGSRAGIDLAVHAIWSDYQPGVEWKRLMTPNEQWLTTITSGISNSASQSLILHYNLFNGIFLINGTPLGRLPGSIDHHPTYIRLLGQKIIHVIPSTLPTMHFATRNAIIASEPNLSLHFRLPNPDGDLIIRAKCGTDIFEHIPHTVFDQREGKDFPSSFITDYAHWLYVSSSSEAVIGFHPLNLIWKPSEQKWCLIFNFDTGTGAMRDLNGSLMIDMRSPSFTMISKRLGPIECSDHLHAALDLAEGGTLVAKLPRFKLEFFVNRNEELECSTIRHMVVDANQSSGTMFGLKNQLLLRDKCHQITRVGPSESRCCIIPFGKVSFKPHGHHTLVEILRNDAPSHKYFVYQIDTTLGRLVGQTLLSDIYKVYLHGCTSFPLPDDLTRRTGTEEALYELETARYFSFQDLTAEEVALFQDIGNLTPVIEWYPKHLKVMQTIHWNKLGPLSQHWAFASRANDVLQFHQQLHLIGIPTSRDGSQSDTDILRDDHLLGRLDSRTFGLYAPGRKHPTPYSDIAYSVADNISHHRHKPTKTTTTLTANVSAFLHHMTMSFDTMPNLWERLCAINILNDGSNTTNSETFSYPELLSRKLSDLFLPLYKACQEHGPDKPVAFRLAFALSTMAYAASNSQDADDILFFVPTIVSFACLSEFNSIDPPAAKHYDLALGVHPNKVTLSTVLERHQLQPPNNQPPQLVGENDEEYRIRRDKHWQDICRRQIESVIGNLEGQWPCQAPSISLPAKSLNLLNIASPTLENEISSLFNSWYNNRSLQLFINQVQNVLNEVRVHSDTPIPRTTVPYRLPVFSHEISSCQQHCLRLRDLCFHREPIPIPPSSSTSPASRLPSQVYADQSIISPNRVKVSQVDTLVGQFSESSDPLHRVYIKALEISLRCYQREVATVASSTRISPKILLLINYYELQRRKFDEAYQTVIVALSPVSPLESALSQAGQWPILNIRTLLDLLSNDNCSASLSPAWERSLVALAQSLIKLQHSRRALLFKLLGRDEELSKELDNSDFETNISFNNPEWLLIQIDSNFTMRPVQSNVAQEMISPSSGRNSLTQLNMGEGKSSVIVPLISSSLADGKKLVRVVTLKPLINQMFELLVRRLSGLANRRIFYLPFSRDFKADPEHLRQLWTLYEACLHERGILLIQPEHILSFRLMGVDLAGGTQVQAAEILLQCHRWLTSVSRDIFDESDEILKVTYQLVYTSGVQQPMDGHPDRWNIIEEVIGYAQNHASVLQYDPKYSLGLEVHKTGEIGCPIIRIIDDQAGEHLINQVVQNVMSNDRLTLLPPRLHAAVSNFITCRDGGNADSELKDLRSSLGSSTWTYLLIYRGLLGLGLLRFVLQEKRWRVDYGLDTSRTLLAVPYRAKDVPSLKADFGHPDVALLLTCLSYYYGGLDENQLDKCFELLFKLDDPPLEYNHWVFRRNEIPSSFRDIKNINLDDVKQRETVLGPLFRKNKAVIDFYLSNVVFPRYARQFPKRLSASSWDLAEIKENQVITGFSGTNDNRYLLPTSIEQSEATIDYDPFGQRATNAKVLDILLQKENDNYFCFEGSNGQAATGNDFLLVLVEQTPGIRVLLDVGAQMLDMQNAELVLRWLSLVPALHAIVFFDDADELVVMSRDRHTERFASSQYKQQLDLCAVYLDDAHTRGTDIRMPTNFRAAVTLGPKLTKDRLVQGCMRMRQLGHGQSVTFFASKEVDRSIRACKLAPLEPSASISSADVLRWAICQTCEDIQRYIPQWAQQGVNYQRRNDAWALHEGDPSAPSAHQILCSAWEEPDAQTLDEMYNRQSNVQASSLHPAFELPHLKERLEDLGVSMLHDSRADEEQEREVSQEAERERQHELPPKVKSAPSTLHPSVISLVESGGFEESSPAFISLFSPMDMKHPWSTALFSTANFARTIQGENASTGNFLRPVNWILSVPQRRVLVVISPFEANALLSKIWNSKHVHLHIYSPRVNMNMKSMEDLKFFSIPPLPASSDRLAFIPDLMLQLNLWAGQLYLQNFKTYQQLCRTLGLVGDEAGTLTCDSEGFVKPEDRTGAMKEECKMVVSPVPLLKELFSFRRKGMGFASTHMGKLLAGKPLDPKDFDD